MLFYVNTTAPLYPSMGRGAFQMSEIKLHIIIKMYLMLQAKMIINLHVY